MSSLSWWVVIIGALTLGLAPFNPPHLWSHYQNMVGGQHLAPLDYFDFIYHLFPWMIFAAKLSLRLRKPEQK